MRSGSSPLARGLLATGMLNIFSTGIIPARAGFTEHFDMMTGFTEDHPRSRGVYTLPRGRLRSRWGSSPLARGLRFSAPR